MTAGITRRVALARIGVGSAAAAVGVGTAPAMAANARLLELVEQWHATWPHMVEAGRELWRVIGNEGDAIKAGAEVGRLRTEVDRIEGAILSLDPRTEQEALALATIPAAFWRDAAAERNNVALAWTDRLYGTMPRIAALAVVKMS